MKFNVVERATQKIVKADVYSKQGAIDFADEQHKSTGNEHEVHKISVIHISRSVVADEIDFG